MRGSRSATPSFDWNNEATWDACLDGVQAVYINYAPDLAMPGATDSIQAFVDKAKLSGVKRLVLVQPELLGGCIRRDGASWPDHAA